MEIILANGAVAFIDDEDFEKVKNYKWNLNEENYVRCTYWDKEEKKNQSLKLHRLVTNCPIGMLVDHINGNKLDNRKSNLRICTRSENNRNVKSFNFKSSTSKYKGVGRHQSTGKWRARISYNSKQIFIGLFDTEEEAGRAYNEKAKELHGEFARLNNL